MLLLVLIVLVTSKPQWLSRDIYTEKECKGEVHSSEFTALDFCRYFRDRSDKFEFKDMKTVTMFEYHDRKCEGAHIPREIKTGCEFNPQEHVKDANLTYYGTKMPTGHFNEYWTSDSSCKGSFEGGYAYYPKEDECVQAKKEQFNSFQYSCDEKMVHFKMYLDDKCQTLQEQTDYPLGCQPTEYEGVYKLVTCHGK